ncbi:MAG: hypothetical protein ABW224_13655 [Kibdelosporangium sp.]
MTDFAHDPFALGDEYVYDPQQPDLSTDKWQQLRASLRHDIADRKDLRDSQSDGDDLHTEYQTEITFMTRQLLALEANLDQLRDAQAAVSRARMYRNACYANDNAFGTHCGRSRNVAGGIGAVALILCCTLDDVPGFLILTAVLGLLAAAGLHTLTVMGGSGRATTAEHADAEWRARTAELHHLQNQVLQGVRNPQPLAHNQPGSPHKTAPLSTAVSLFPQQHTDSQSADSGSSR